MYSSKTPENLETRYWRTPDYERAKSELSQKEVAELVRDVELYEGKNSADEIAEAFLQDDSELYNQNQLSIREVAKETVNKHEQPDWAWSLLSFYSEDFGRRMMDLPSEGEHKGLIVDEDFEKAFLYSKKSDGIPAIEHVHTWYENALNASSIGYALPAENYEITSIDMPDKSSLLGEPVLMMDYNGDMILDSKLDDYLTEKEIGPEAIQNREDWVKDVQRDRRNRLEGLGVPEADYWIVGLEFLIENEMLENWGAIEYKRGIDNTAINPNNMERILVDLGEIRDEERLDSSSGEAFTGVNRKVSNQRHQMSSQGDEDLNIY